MQRCPYCEYDNEDGVLYCENCKQDLNLRLPPPPDADLIAHEGRDDLILDSTDFGRLPSEEPLSPALPVGEAERYPDQALFDAEVITEAGSAPTEPEGLEPFDTMHGAPITERRIDQPMDVPDALEIEDVTPSGRRPVLVVIRGERVDMRFPIYEGPNYVGRTDEKPVDVDLECQEPEDQIWTSRQHAVIHYENGSLTIEDLNSLNGTFVNRTRIYPGQRRALQENDILQIGKVQLRLTFA
jgi:hypothetical protein